MNDYILCNIPSCRKPLTVAMWITRCSHVFCDKHASEFKDKSNKNVSCQLCRRPLSEPYDIVRQTTKPTEDFKSTILTGLHPEIVLDILRNALKFWSFQMRLEANFQKEEATRIKLYYKKQDHNYYKAELTKLENDLTETKRKCQAYEEDIKIQGSKIKELKELLLEKSKHLQRIQSKLPFRSKFRVQNEEDKLRMQKPKDSDQTRQEEFLFEPFLSRPKKTEAFFSSQQ